MKDELFIRLQGSRAVIPGDDADTDAIKERQPEYKWEISRQFRTEIF